MTRRAIGDLCSAKVWPRYFADSKRTALELEIVKEQAGALGIAGKKLHLSLEAYVTAELQAFPGKNEDKLLSAIAEAVYGLLLQREFLGFIEGNLEWICSSYRIPDKAMPLLGRTNKSQE
jgi:hypothetical protein